VSDPRLAAALAAHEEGRPDEARRLYLELLRADPGDAAAGRGLALAQVDLGENDAARTGLMRALERAPSDAVVWNSLGLIHFRGGALEAALSAFETAVGYDPAYSGAWSNRGLALHELDRMQEAISSFDRALLIDPDFLAARFNRANSLAAASEMAAAERDYMRVIKDAPGLTVARFNLGLMLQAAARFADALAQFDAALMDRPADGYLHYQRGMALQGLRQHRDAADAFSRAARQVPRFADAVYGEGLALGAAGRPGEGAEKVLTAIGWAPEVERYQHAMASLLNDAARAGDGARAAELARLWLLASPGSAIAAHVAAAHGGSPAPRAGDDYVKTYFDAFAPTFEAKLQSLDYSIPDRIGAVAAGLQLPPNPHILDAGCGTGLAAPFLRPLAERLTGVDLAPAMLAMAREKGLYDELAEAELTRFLSARPDAFDLIAAADVLCYFGALEEVLGAAALALKPGGWLAASLEEERGEQPWRLAPHGRYSHQADYIAETAAAAGLRVVARQDTVLRLEAGLAVCGFIFTFLRE